MSVAAPPRRDVFLNCSQRTLALSGQHLGGQDRTALSRNLPGAVEAGLVVPVGLIHPGPLVVRVVEGALTEREQSEWVGHFASWLQIPDGRLGLENGFPPYADLPTLRTVKVTRGNSRVDVYTFMGGSLNGEVCQREVGGGVKIGAWFRQTRPGEEFPDWLAIRCMDYPEMDPGYESDWTALAGSKAYGRTLSRLEARPPVAFVVQLTPLRDRPTPPMMDAHGCIRPGLGARLTDFCPRGLDALVPLRDETEDTDLPMSTELPESIGSIGATTPRSSLLARLKRWWEGSAGNS